MSSATLGTEIDRKVDEIRKIYFLKVKKKFFIAVFVIVIFLTLLHFFKLSISSKIQKRNKRHVTTPVFDVYEDDVKMPKKNVEIVPEHRRTYHHPNHKYTDGKIYEEALNNSFSKRLRSKMQVYPGSIQDVILKGKLKYGHGKAQNKFITDILKDSRSSMRLKGVYRQPGFTESQLEEGYGYSNEINNLMQEEFGNRGKWIVKNALRGRGAPFQLPGRENLRPQKPNSQLDKNLKKLPITIYLDFYPVVESRRKKSNPLTTPSTPSDVVPKESVNVEKFLPPRMKYNGIIMKLNLYPKALPERNVRKSAGGSHLKYSEKAERKFFGWFSKHKKKKKDHHPKECSFIGLNPNEKHITAKWKNEEGECIHA